jgi:hypothetical protein
LTVGCTVVNHSDRFALELGHGVAAQRATQLGVVSHHAERGFEALTGVLGVGCRWGDLGNTCITVNFGCGNGGAGVQMTNYACHFGINQFLSDCGPLLGVCSVVFSHQLKRDLVPADHDTRSVQFFDSQASTILIVLTQVGDGTAGGADMPNFDNRG